MATAWPMAYNMACSMGYGEEHGQAAWAMAYSTLNFHFDVLGLRQCRCKGAGLLRHVDDNQGRPHI